MLQKTKLREERVFSLDVECAATGRGHNDRAACRIGLVELVDGHCKVVLDKVCRVPNMLDPLTQVTGLTEEEIGLGEPLEDVLKELRDLLGPDVVLVGQCVTIDIEWCNLKKGVDFGRTVELDQELIFTTESKDSRERTWLDKRFCSLNAKANALLGKNLHEEGKFHSPVDDATVSLEIFRNYILSGRIHEARERLKEVHLKGELPRKVHVSIAGICSAKFNSKHCFCGQPVVKRNHGTVIGANEPCFEFINKAGYCYRGDACRYRHDFSDLSRKTKVCYKWRQGRCHRGVRCAFSHEGPERPVTTSSDEAGSFTASRGESRSGGADARWQPDLLPPTGDSSWRGQNLRETLCTNFTRGGCRFGANCWFKHEFPIIPLP